MADTEELPECRFGSKCYRKNADHWKKFRHPPSTRNENVDDEQAEDEEKESSPRKTKRQKIEKKIQKRDEDEDEKSGEKEENDFPHSDRHYENQADSLEGRKKFIKEHFQFEMPDDFYALWDVASALKPKDPCDAFSSVELILCGPFDVLAGKFDDKMALKAEDFILHCRYYYDVPEFQTVIRHASSEETDNLFHIGYLRDEAGKDAIVCSNDGESHKLSILGDNLFSAIHDYIKSSEPKGHEKLMKSIEDEAKKHNFPLTKSTKKIKDRNKKSAAKTFHGAGIVVPMQGDVGYRPLGMSDDDLKKILKRIGECDDDGNQTHKDLRNKALSELQETITYVQFANDECDFGMGYELGIDIFCSGYEKLHPYVKQLLPIAYTLLHRPEFKKILEIHLAKRQRGLPFMAI